MRPLRVCIVLAAFAAVALTLVRLRIEQNAAARRTLALETRWVELRRELWSLQTRLARHRAPGRVRDRLGWAAAELIPPGEDEPVWQPSTVVDRTGRRGG